MGPNLVISQYWMSNSHGIQRKVTFEPPRTTAETIRPIASSPLATSISTPGISRSTSSLMIRAGRSCPSPMSAVRTRIRGGRSSDREAPESSAPAACSLPLREGFLPGIGSGARVLPRTHSTYWRTPSRKLVFAFQSSSSRARALEISLPGKSPGRGGVWTISQPPVISCTVSAISRIVTTSSPDRL